jgi:hypothetical protein
MMFLPVVSQVEYEILIYNAAVNDFDVIGDDSYEKSNRGNQDITEKLVPEISATIKAEPAGADNFEPKNLLDGNMKTCWMSSNDGKNEKVEIIIDLEEVENVKTASINAIYFFSGWRKDFKTWKEYSRIKKLNMMVNDMPYAEILFEDTYKQQSIDLEKFKIDRTRRCRIRFQVVDTYPGTKENKVAISDIQLLGKAKQ